MKYKQTLLGAYCVSSAGDWIFKFSIPLYLYALKGSAQSIAIGYALTFLPFLIWSIPGGVLGDRINKKRLLIMLDFAAAGLCFMLYWVMSNSVNLTMIYLLIFLIASLGTVYHSTFQGSLPLVFERSELPGVNAKIMSVDSIFSTLGPIFGVSVALYLGYEYAILINAVSFLLSALSIAIVRFAPTIPTHAPIRAMIKEGLTETFNNDFVRFGATLFLFTNFALHLYLSIFIFYLKDTLAISDVQVGLVYAVAGLFSIFGSFAGKKLVQAPSAKPHHVISLSVILSGVATLPIALTDNWIIVTLFWSAICFLGAMNVVVFFTERQKRVPTEVLSRVVAISRLVAYASIPVGALCGGWLAGYFSVPWLIFSAGIYRIIVGFWAHKKIQRQTPPLQVTPQTLKGS